MAARVRMESDDIGPRSGKIGDDPIHRLDHQVHIQWRSDAVIPQRLDDNRTEGEVGHVVVIHHIHVNVIGAGRKDCLHLRAQPGHVG